MDNLSFKSSIKFVTPKTFAKRIEVLSSKANVCSPWTVNETVVGKNAYTEDVIDCVVLGLTNGKKVLMCHICPTKKQNEDFQTIETFINRKVDFKKDSWKGFLFGSKPYWFMMDERSEALFGKFFNFLQKKNVPFSFFKGGEDVHNVAYFAKTDEWLITNVDDNKYLKGGAIEDLLKNREFDEFRLSKFDDLYPIVE